MSASWSTASSTPLISPFLADPFGSGTRSSFVPTPAAPRIVAAYPPSAPSRGPSVRVLRVRLDVLRIFDRDLRLTLWRSRVKPFALD